MTLALESATPMTVEWRFYRSILSNGEVYCSSDGRLRVQPGSYERVSLSLHSQLRFYFYGCFYGHSIPAVMGPGVREFLQLALENVHAVVEPCNVAREVIQLDLVEVHSVAKPIHVTRELRLYTA